MGKGMQTLVDNGESLKYNPSMASLINPLLLPNSLLSHMTRL